MDVEKLLIMTTTDTRTNQDEQRLFKNKNIYELAEHDEGHLCDCLPEYLVLILSPIGLPDNENADDIKDIKACVTS